MKRNALMLKMIQNQEQLSEERVPITDLSSVSGSSYSSEIAR